MTTKLSRMIMYATIAASMVACGGGGDEASAPPQTATAVDPGKIVATESNHPPVTGPSASTDSRRADRGEGFRPGIDAEGTTPVDASKLAVQPEGRVKALAVGDPITKAMGETDPVAPVPTTITAGAQTKGMWSGVYNWPLIPIHMAQMPDGRLMSFGTTEGGRQTGKTVYAMFDPKDGLFNGHTVYPKETLADIFCSALIFLPITNQALTVGGDNLQADGFTNNTGNNASTIYTPSTNTMVAGKNMALPRWYATTTTLADGTTYIQGGLGGEAYPEVRLANGNYRSLTAASTTNLDYWYPRNFLHPNGKVFGYDSYGNYYFITTTGTGVKQIVNQWDVNNFGEAGSAAVYAPGRVLQLAAFSNKAAIIDFRTANPTMTQTAPMEQRRQNVSAVTLPNGKVVATGGSLVYNEIGAAAGNYFKASTWDPATGTWTQSDPTPSGLARLYHSIAMLMTDGSVLVGGGGAWGPLSNNNVEFYYPSYLFNADGTWATKPKVTVAPSSMDLGSTLKFTVDDTGAPITKVVIIKTSATTHSLNMDQAYNQLTFTRTGNEITATLPTEVAYATPGYYMLFTMTARDTPSQARIIRMNVPNSVTNPPTAAAAALNGTTVNLSWTQSTSTGVTRNIISRSTSATGPWTDLKDITAATTYALTNQPNGTYYYAIKAVGAAGNPSANSNVVAVTVGGGTQPPVLVVPTAPTGVAATYAAATGTTITWTNPTATTTMPAVQQSIVARGTNVNGPFTTLATIGATTYTDPNQVAGTYFYQITPVNSVGNGASAVSNSVTITSVTPPVGTLAAPTGLSGYTCGAGCWSTDTGVRFNWTPTSGVTNHVVQRAAALAGPYTTVATLGATATVYIDKNVTSGTTYFYRVQATTATNTSPYATLGYGIQSNITLGGGTTPTSPANANIVATPTSATVGSPVALSGSTSTPGTGATIVGYQWTITAGGTLGTLANANTVNATLNPTAAGSITLSLTVTDNQGGTNTETLTIPVVAAPVGGTFGIESQGETRYLVMNWWRANPALEGDFRDPTDPNKTCTGPQTSGGNCFLGARKTFRPIAFKIGSQANGEPVATRGLVLMDVPQYENGVKTYDHYRLPVQLVKNPNECSFYVRHVRTVAAGQDGHLEFPLNPPGLEILPHKFNMTASMCSSFPTGAMTTAWLNTLNTALTTYLGAKPAYAPIAYPYHDPRTGVDPAIAP